MTSESKTSLRTNASRHGVAHRLVNREETEIFRFDCSWKCRVALRGAQSRLPS